MEDFCTIGLFYIFSQTTTIISSTFSTFLVDNQVGRDQNHTRLSAKKVKKCSISQTHFEKNLTLGGLEDLWHLLGPESHLNSGQNSRKFLDLFRDWENILARGVCVWCLEGGGGIEHMWHLLGAKSHLIVDQNILGEFSGGKNKLSGGGGIYNSFWFQNRYWLSSKNWRKNAIL